MKNRNSTKVSENKLLNEIKGYLEAIIIAVIITTFLFTTVGVAGSSMSPSLEGGSTDNLFEALISGDRLFLPKYSTWLKRIGVGEYERGDVIVFREPPGKPCHPGASGRRAFLVKRLIGLPGDHVVVNTDGSVFLNGVKLNQSFITGLEGGRVRPTNAVDLVVQSNHFFVMGDNRPNSCDSRAYGSIPFQSIAGKATAVVWPIFRQGKLNLKLVTSPTEFALIPQNAD